VKYTHLCDSVTTHFPLWLIALWATVLDLQKTVRKPWVQAREWLGTELRQQRSRERRALAEDAKAFFGALPWDNNAVCNMWRFIGPHWTTSSMQNDLLDELSNRITACVMKVTYPPFHFLTFITSNGPHAYGHTHRPSPIL
jgi:hypothetical protein